VVVSLTMVSGDEHSVEKAVVPITVATTTVTTGQVTINHTILPTTTTGHPFTTTTVNWASVRLEPEAAVDQVAPARLVIEAIAIEAPIVALGVDAATGDMEVPDNVDEVGWYRFGPVPGGPGSAVMAAHVDLAGEGPGVFYNLDHLAKGDAIEIALTDGGSLRFLVTDSARVPKVDLDVVSLFSPDGDPLLRLVTCGGAFDRASGSYQDNIVVTARLVG
jgi:sortase (surface protein transpeptidase)